MKKEYSEKEIYRLKSYDRDECVVYVSKNNLGQKMELEFSPSKCGTDTWWSVCFWIGKRNKGFQWMESTGRDGIKSLLWAKSVIIDFIKELESSGKRHHISVWWDDNRRRNTYIRGLTPIGFNIDRVGSIMRLHKKINC